MERDEFCKKDLDGVNEEFIVYKYSKENRITHLNIRFFLHSCTWISCSEKKQCFYEIGPP